MIDISVIMPVFNEEKYLHEAIDSILHQTFDRFEFIIIDDASTDNSLAIIQSYADERIVLICNEYNVGNYPSRNKGLEIAVGKYIVSWMQMMSLILKDWNFNINIWKLVRIFGY